MAWYVEEPRIIKDEEWAQEQIKRYKDSKHRQYRAYASYLEHWIKTHETKEPMSMLVYLHG